MNNLSSTSEDSRQTVPPSKGVVDAWYQGAWWLYLLLPFSLLYFVITFVRRCLYRLGIFASYKSKIPTIVVGNITLGGTGKSPLTSALINALRDAGYKPGIVSRGYGAQLAKNECREVHGDSSTSEVGDEPLMLKKMLGCPVFVSPSRRLAVQALENTACDVVICDDGLQHYALQRDIEICVFDGERGIGNGFLLPSGPLRESAKRARNVDFVVINGADSLHNLKPDKIFRMDLCPVNAQSLLERESVSLASFKQQKVHAIAAIGNPERFFVMLEECGIEVIRHPFDDHHAFAVEDFSFTEELPIIMTEKDAVKCLNMNLENAWYIPVNAKIDQSFFKQVVDKLKEV